MNKKCIRKENSVLSQEGETLRSVRQSALEKKGASIVSNQNRVTYSKGILKRFARYFSDFERVRVVKFAEKYVFAKSAVLYLFARLNVWKFWRERIVTTVKGYLYSRS